MYALLHGQKGTLHIAPMTLLDTFGCSPPEDWVRQIMDALANDSKQLSALEGKQWYLECGGEQIFTVCVVLLS